MTSARSPSTPQECRIKLRSPAYHLDSLPGLLHECESIPGGAWSGRNRGGAENCFEVKPGCMLYLDLGEAGHKFKAFGLIRKRRRAHKVCAAHLGMIYKNGTMCWVSGETPRVVNPGNIRKRRISSEVSVSRSKDFRLRSG